MADASVWTSSRAEWAKKVTAARRVIRQAERDVEIAYEDRCPAKDSAGAQCTRDAQPEHQHRIDLADLPELDTDHDYA